jgi:hypothetical protein
MTNKCCQEHLVRTGRVVAIADDGQLLVNPAHCIDGERARCSTCKRTWVHVCDEAEGCSWTLAPKRKAKST